MLSNVYLSLYSTDHYLDTFDKDILDYIEKSGFALNRVDRSVLVDIRKAVKDADDVVNATVKYYLHDIEWVKNNKDVKDNIIERIDNQFILI